MSDKAIKLLCDVDDCRIRVVRWGEKKDYKKGDSVEITDVERATYLRRNGWKVVETTDASSKKVVKQEKATRTADKKEAVSKAKKAKK